MKKWFARVVLAAIIAFLGFCAYAVLCIPEAPEIFRVIGAGILFTGATGVVICILTGIVWVVMWLIEAAKGD